MILFALSQTAGWGEELPPISPFLLEGESNAAY